MTDLTRILNDGFFLSALGDELDVLAKSRSKALRDISGELRKTLIEHKRWPSDKAGRLALILWLLAGRNREIVSNIRLRHKHEKIEPVRDALKPRTKPLFKLKHDGLQ